MPLIVILAIAWWITCAIYRSTAGIYCAARNIEPPWIRNKRERMASQDQRRARRYEAMRSRRTLRGFLGRLWGDMWEDWNDAREAARERRRKAATSPVPTAPPRATGRWGWLRTAWAAIWRTLGAFCKWLAEQWRALLAWLKSMRGKPAPDSTGDTWYYATCQVIVATPYAGGRRCNRPYRYLIIIGQYGITQSQIDCGNHVTTTRDWTPGQPTTNTEYHIPTQALPVLPPPPVLGARFTALPKGE